jgi:integrase
MATIIKRGPKQWQAKVRRRNYPLVTKTFATKADAEAWVTVTESQMLRKVYVSHTEADRTTLREALERYQREVTPAKKSAHHERQRIEHWKRQKIADRPLASIRSVDVASYRDERLAAGRSPITVNNELILLSHLFSVARKEWGMESLANPVSLVRRPRLPQGRDRRLATGEEERLLEAAESPLRELIVLALETGMRQGELRELRWDSVDMATRVLTLQDTKNGTRRRVPLSSRALSALRDLDRIRRIDGRVFPWLGADTVSHSFRRVCGQAGIVGLRFHDLRHEATSRLFERGLNIMEVASVTGHKTLQMLKRYTHPKAEELAVKLG